MGLWYDAAEVAVRRPVWSALADVFLDTETRQRHPWRAWVCAQSGLTVSELESCFFFDLQPRLGNNRGEVAGEWSAFDLDGLVAEIVDGPASPMRARGAVALARQDGPGALEFSAILGLRDVLAGWDESEVEFACAVWDEALLHTPVGGWRYDVSRRRASAIVAAVLPVAERLRVTAQDRTPADGAAAVAALVSSLPSR